MNLYIETENGTTKNHPAYEDNLIQAFGEIPARWEPFVRAETPVPTVYQKLYTGEPSYIKINGVWTDEILLQEMTDEEKVIKQQFTKDAWTARPDAENFTAWVLDEATCTMVSPTPRPANGNYFWQGTTASWQPRLAYPDDGKNYKLNLLTGVWDEVSI
jgi:hypothetical protein